MIRCKFLVAFLAAMALAGVTQGALAQAFPSKQIRILVPFPPGGPTDTMARLLAARVSTNTGQPVVVDNRPGAAGQIAVAALKQSDPDGYSILFGDIGVLAVNSTLYTTLSYDVEKDLAPITNLTSMPMILLVPAIGSANSVADLLAAAKDNPNGITFASQGPGTGGHLLGEMFRSRTGVKMTHVPYKGSAPAVADLISGRVDLLFDVTLVARGNVAGGKLKALATASSARSTNFPELRTMDELGIPGVAMDVWFGAVGRAGTPPAVIRRLNEELVQALGDPETNKRFLELTMVPRPMSPEQFAQFMKDEARVWGGVVKAAGIRVD